MSGKRNLMMESVDSAAERSYRARKRLSDGLFTDEGNGDEDVEVSIKQSTPTSKFLRY